MHGSWVHVGRLWTNGEPHLAIDAARRGEWRGYSDDDFDRIIALGEEPTNISVGLGTAALVGGDGVVRDDSWIEVFESDDGTIAFIQASGDNYTRTLVAVLDYPDTADLDGDDLVADSGELAIFNSGLDGTGEHSARLSPARPGPTPAVHGPPSREPDPGLLIRTGRTKPYQFKIRRYTELDNEDCFARWLLVPTPDPH